MFRADVSQRLSLISPFYFTSLSHTVKILAVDSSLEQDLASQQRGGREQGNAGRVVQAEMLDGGGGWRRRTQTEKTCSCVFEKLRREPAESEGDAH